MNSSDDNINSGDNPQRHHRGMPNNNGGDGRHTVGSLRDLLESLKFDMNGEGGGGDGGGEIICFGTPEYITSFKNSYTGQYLKPLLS